MELTELGDEVEIISRVYERRFGVARTDDWLVLKLHEEVGELTQAYLARSGRSRDRGEGDGEVDAAFRAELADVLAQLLLVARRFDVDLEAEIERKWFRWRHLVEPADEAGVRPEG
ncbi:pyrophosphatase [Isoptericola nanjingensis]|uniref:pyrophosphatase n=1 Tax=Isoptericola TaxID=254250 RepID=UPI0037928165